MILYSSVVSRYHVELHRQALGWELVNLGANGTYVDERQIDKERVRDGMTIRLATTGPRLQIILDAAESMSPSLNEATNQPKTSKLTVGRPTFVSRR